ncbi:hypothetical protein D3C72_1283480 [compost metagenome]
MLFIQPRGGEQFGRPFARAGIEPGGAGGVGHFRDVFAGQPQTQIILRQQYLGHFREDIGFVLRHPGKLRRGEAGENDVAGDLAETRIGIQRGGLGMGARIVPQDAGAQHLAISINKRRTMHLAGKADALYGAKLFRKLLLQAGNGCSGRGNPVRRVLFGPAVMRARNVQRAVGRADDFLIAVHQQGFDA